MYQQEIQEALKALQISPRNAGSSTGKEWLKGSSTDTITSSSPADGKVIASVNLTTEEDYREVVRKASGAFMHWRKVPAPKRGEVIRQIGLRLREQKENLGMLVSYEMGKIYQEGLGEVQEMIDICDFAVGLSRQLYGLTLASERPDHRMMEQWHPLGPVGIISAFNFPVAVYSWNAFIAGVCGDPVIWKPSEKSTLCAIAVQKIIASVLEEHEVPEGVFNLVTGDHRVGEMMTSDERLPLISATGSIRMGRIVGQSVARRLGKTILELGGNNGVILSQHADLDMALMAILFGAVGTAGQRCTSTRRLIIHESVYDNFRHRLVDAYKQARTGHPLDEQTLMGPLIDADAVKNFLQAIDTVVAEGGKLLTGGEKLAIENNGSGCYVTPAIVEADPGMKIVCEETFAPLLYLMKYRDLDEAIRIHNRVPQGLSSAIFSLNVREVEYFLSASGSDCGIANANIGTSGAEIGGAFGGEKETGGGREAGSDAWKAYMRRQTNTVNYGSDLPLAQGIKFQI